MQKYILEVCAGNYASVQAAIRAGAHRLELCSALSEGGLTPSVGFLRTAVAFPGVEKFVLVRPRGGDFLYTPEEQDIMVEDIRTARELGADGIVVGALREDGAVDEKAMQRFISAADGLPVTFHRAFDVCCSPFEALEVIIGLGCARLLTSGCSSSAYEGMGVIKELVRKADGRIIVMPGCGVTAENARGILRQTGVTEIHASATVMRGSRMNFRRDDVAMGTAGADEYAVKESDEVKVREILNALYAM